MFEWGRRRMIRNAALLLVLAGRAPLPAQDARPTDAASLLVLLDSARHTAERAESAYVAAREAIVARRSQRIVVGGLAVRFSTQELTDADTAAIAEGLRRARERLSARFGASGLGLLDSGTWMASRARQRSRFNPMVTVRTRVAGGGISWELRRPMVPADVERFALRVAGDGLDRLGPSLFAFAGGTATLADDPARWAEAAREMALSWAAAGRRCAVGSLGACKAVMTLRRPGEAMPAWIEESDYRAAVTASALGPTADPALVADRRRCLRGADEVCAAVVARVDVVDPFSANLRGSLVMHAVDLGGRDALLQFSTAPDRTPLPLLAHVAGVSEDSLLASWQARSSEALRDERGSPAPLALSTAGWCALVLLGIGRRRP